MIAAVSILLPEIFTMASRRPANEGNPSSSNTTRSAVAKAGRDLPSPVQTTPKLSLWVPRYPVETVPPTMTTSPNATKTVFGTTGTPIRRQSTPSPAAMDRCVTTTVVSVGP
ncbi:Uncharacterised protein [Mycobacteroides abscessus subsp. abscessus]|nr:Uncharacterised protein [Mycobacteroides abscessus subsp. abscessus]